MAAKARIAPTTARTGLPRTSYEEFLDWSDEDTLAEWVDGKVRDRGAKYGEYEAGGVREYWVLDPTARRTDFFVLDPEGRYQRAVPGADGRYRSETLPGLWISVAWLWQSPLPRMRDVLTVEVGE